MTDAQWLFEYIILREKEKEELELISNLSKGLKNMLVNILGLNLMNTEKDDSDVFIPMSIMVARREVVEKIVEELDKKEVVASAAEDENFEKISKAIANGDDLGDMSPMFDIDSETNAKLDTWLTPSREQELLSLGVKLVDTPINKNIVHVDINADEIKQKKINSAFMKEQAKKDMEEQIKQDKLNKRNKDSVKVTFDD